jgi:hypothetical protein
MAVETVENEKFPFPISNFLNFVFVFKGEKHFKRCGGEEHKNAIFSIPKGEKRRNIVLLSLILLFHNSFPV